MNAELLKQIKDQCWVEKQWDKENERWIDRHVDLNKFAMLIIQECIRVPYAMWDKAELNADVAVKIDHKIKDHFGVEE
jgi:hypothetical protein